VRELAILLLHVLATVVRLAGPGGVRAVVAESVLVKQQLLILNRARTRSPRLRLGDRVAAGLCALLMRPRRLVCVAIVLKPSTLLRLHRALTTRTGEPGDGRQEMEKQDNQVRHVTIVNKVAESAKMLAN
jgi:putative transposase